MNKYEQAIDTVANWFPFRSITPLKDNSELKEAIQDLQHLVDRATPKKPIRKVIINDFDNWDYSMSFKEDKRHCPNKNCNRILTGDSDYINMFEYPHCPNCGQALDWSDE